MVMFGKKHFTVKLRVLLKTTMVRVILHDFLDKMTNIFR